MDCIKTEINLRTREFVVSREFYWPRVLGTLGGLLVILALVGGSVLLYLYQVNLNADIHLLRRNVEQLQIEVAPIAALEAEIRSIKAKARLKDSLTGLITFSWSDMLQEIDGLAVQGTIDLDYLFGHANGEIIIKGHGPTMRSVAAYLQESEQLDFLHTVAHSYISLNPTTNRFGFEAKASLVDGGSE